MQECKPSTIPADPGMKLSHEMSPSTDEDVKEMSRVPYAELCGAVNYLSNCTRPDIVYAARELARFMSSPGRQHFEQLKMLLRYLKG